MLKNFLLILIITFLFSENILCDEYSLNKAKKFMKLHNERGYHHAEMIFSNLENTYKIWIHHYLRIKNLLNWGEYLGRTRYIQMDRILSFVDSLILRGLEFFPDKKKYFLLLHAFSLGLKDHREKAQIQLKQLKKVFPNKYYYDYLVWKFSGYRPDPNCETIDNILRINPGFFKARLDRARAYFNKGILHLATGEALNLASKHPRSPWVLTFLGVCLIEHNEIGKALNLFRKALSIENYSPAVFEIGRSLYFHRKIKESIEFFVRAIKINSNNMGAHFFLGKTYMILRENKKAVNHFKIYIELNPNGMDREDIELWISMLSGNKNNIRFVFNN